MGLGSRYSGILSPGDRIARAFFTLISCFSSDPPPISLLPEPPKPILLLAIEIPQHLLSCGSRQGVPAAYRAAYPGDVAPDLLVLVARGLNDGVAPHTGLLA